VLRASGEEREGEQEEKEAGGFHGESEDGWIL
jgi:hypothetical protein